MFTPLPPISVIVMLNCILPSLNTEVSFAGCLPEKAGGKVWSYNYSTGGADLAFAVATDSKDNIVVVGEHGSGAASDWNVTKLDSDGNQIWSYNYSGVGDSTARGVAIDSKDNIIVVGDVKTANDWNVTKLNSDGDQLWSYTYNGGGGDFPNAVVVDSKDNIIVVGQHGSGTDWNVTKLDSSNSAPNQLWSYNYSSGGFDAARGVATDSQDNIIVVGQAAGDWNVTKLNSDGDQLWSYTYDSGGSDKTRGVAIDSKDNIIVVGEEGGNWNVTKLDSSNSAPNQLWSYIYNGGGVDIARAVAIDSKDNIIVVGEAGTDWNVTKLNSDGDQLWSYTYNAGGTLDSARGVATDSQDNIIVVGGAGADWNVTKLSGGGNPLSCGVMSQGDKCQLNWTINASGDIGTVLVIDVNFSSSLVGVEANDTEDHLIKIIASEAPPVLDTEPPIINGTLNKSITNIFQNDIINATYNFTDDSGNVTWVNISINTTTGIRWFNFSINSSSLTTRQISQNFTVDDSAGNVWNVSALISDNSSNYAQNDTIFTVQEADTCTYTSGDWNVDCADNCVISSAVDVGGNNIYITGTGTFTTTARISNFNQLRIEGTDANNICEVRCEGACFED